jgi:hypothetical protein
MRIAHFAIGILIGAVLFTTASVLIAWTGPTSAPPTANIAAPINTGTTDQIKEAGLGLDALAVFGNAMLSGASRYLNFGDSPGESGYGIRDHAGTMEFKSEGGAWRSFLASTGVTSINFADGTTQTTASAGSSCPAGFTLLTSHGQSLGCLQTNQQGSADFPTAANTCFSLFGGRLPSYSEMHVGFTNYTLTNENGGWLDDGSGPDGYATGYNTDDVGNIGRAAADEIIEFRCFIPL